MDAEERELRVRHRVDQAPHQVPPLRPEQIVLAPEGDDADVRRRPGEPGHHVGVEARAVDEPARADLEARGRQREALGAVARGQDAGAGLDGGAGLDQLAREVGGHRAVVDDGGRGGVDGADGGGVRLQLAQAVPVDQGEAGDGVGRAALEESLETRQLGRLGGDDDLAHALDADTLARAELRQEPGALDAEAGLERAGPVVDPRVDDAAVVTGLVLAESRLLLQDHEAGPGRGPEEGAGGGEADDPSADDGDVVAVGAHRPPLIRARARAVKRRRRDRVATTLIPPSRHARNRLPGDPSWT